MILVAEQELDRLQVLLLTMPAPQQFGARLFTMVATKAISFAVHEGVSTQTLHTMVQFLAQHLVILDGAADKVEQLRS